MAEKGKTKAERLKIRASGYSQHGASRTNPTTAAWRAYSKSPAEDITENLELLRTRSRDLYAGGGPLGRGAVDRLVLNAVGPGLTLNCRISAEFLGMSEEEAAEWEQNTEREFGFWAESKNCDVARQMNFYELQNLCFRSVLINGDALVMTPMRRIRGWPYDLRVALIEGDRLCNPSPRPPGRIIDGGVELNEEGAPVAYHIANRHPLAEQIGQPRLEYACVPAFGRRTGRRNVLHLLPVERIGQHRGVPFLAPIIEILKQLGRYTDAELMAAVVGGIYALFFEHAPRDGDLGEEEFAADEGEGFLEDLPNSMLEMYGMVMDLPEGVSPRAVSPGRPNQAFDGFVMSLVRQIGSALGIPAEVLLMNFVSSYSASRGALLEAWKLFHYWRGWWADNFCQPIYNEWLCEAVLKGRVRAPGFFEDPMIAYAYSWAEWNGPSQGQLNPVQEVKAAALRVENGFSTRQRETAELTGGDWEMNHRQRVKEETMRREAGLTDSGINTSDDADGEDERENDEGDGVPSKRNGGLW